MINTAKTAVLLAMLGGICVTAGGLIGQQTGLVMGLLVGLVLVGGSYWFSDKIAIRSARAQPVSVDQMPQYHRIMHELCNRADMPMPKLYMSPSPQPNAFATGRGPNNAAVCITEGLVHAMGWNEIRGVLAHELAHIRNRDVLICSVAAAIGTGITFAANMAMWASVFGSSDDRRDGHPAAQLLFAILAPIAATLVQAAVSRSREFQADISAAKLIGDGRPLARALERLESHSRRIPSGVNPSQASAYIVNPLKAQAASGGGFGKLLSSHPPTSERIRRLQAGDWR